MEEKGSKVAGGTFRDPWNYSSTSPTGLSNATSTISITIPKNSSRILTVGLTDLVPADHPLCVNGRNFSIGYAGNFEAVGASSGSIMVTSYSPGGKGNAHIITNTKAAKTAPANETIQFDLEVLDKDGKPVSGSVGEYRIKVARSVSGGAMKWSDGFGIRNGESFISITAEPGYYVVRLYRSNTVVGEWGSIPVNAGVTNLVLQIGRSLASR